MMGMEIKWVDDSHGMDLQELKNVCEQYKDELAALMVTYPSTHGVFEEGIVECIQTVHDNGGLVYMDGANMNAHLGLTAPGIIHFFVELSIFFGSYFNGLIMLCIFFITFMYE